MRSKIINRKGEELPLGVWHNFGGNVSLMAKLARKNTKRLKFSIRCDTTGKVVEAAGPASEDAIAMGLYRSETPIGYAEFCFGRDYVEREADHVY